MLENHCQSVKRYKCLNAWMDVVEHGYQTKLLKQA